MARAYAIGTNSGEDAPDETGICLKCGYQLAGLGEQGNCPECGSGFGREWVIAGYKNRGGPGSTVGWGIGFLLLGGADLLFTAFSNPSLLSLGSIWEFIKDPCSIIGLIMLAIGLRGVITARTHGGDLRWVLTDTGIYSIRDNGSAGKPIAWSDVRKVHVPFVFGLSPRRWRLLKIRRRWGASMDVFRRKAPGIWVKGRTRGELTALAVDINLRFLEREPAQAPEDVSSEEQSIGQQID
ncbi:MAG: hypothetical protein VX641_00615 [Planctomycetota bacterium]|nr:hypothetical protein [Planctomycetota bacterium]